MIVHWNLSNQVTYKKHSIYGTPELVALDRLPYSDTIHRFHCVYRQADPVAMELGCVCGSSYREHNSLGESGEVVDGRLEVATAHLR